jgi:hypothetical protein
MKLMNKISFFLIALMIANFANAQEKIASPAETVSRKINEATITIKYSSPSVKGREIWGKLVPYNEVWRAGANDATTFQTDKDIIVEGSKLPAGTYSFFVIPNKEDCVIVFNTVVKQWGAYKYDAGKDQLRIKVKQKISDVNAEKLIYTINSNNIVLSWEKWKIGFTVK